MKEAINELKGILRDFITITKINPNSEDSIFKAKKILNKISLEDVISTLRNWHEKTKQEVDSLINDATASFRKAVNEFITNKQQEGISTREYSNKWRVGSLEVYLNEEKSQVKISYNEQTIINFKPIFNSEDINRIYSDADRMLKENLIPIEKRKQLFWGTYEFLRLKNMIKPNLMYPERVPLQDFYNEFKLTFIRENKYKVKDYPLWAFLYNLDDYMKIEHNDLLGDQRLTLFTGTQRETSTIGMVTNGLNANTDYKKYCYIGRG